MKEKDLILLLNFILRTGMFIYKENKDTIIAFIHGFESGWNNNRQFTETLSDSLGKEFKIRRNATGWHGQIERIAEKLEIGWTIVFKRGSLDVLFKEFEQLNSSIFVDSIRKRIDSKLSGINNHFDKDWMIDWFTIVDLQAGWFKSIWTEQEFILLEEVQERLKYLGEIKCIPENIEATENLKNLVIILLKELEKKG